MRMPPSARDHSVTPASTDGDQNRRVFCLAGILGALFIVSAFLWSGLSRAKNETTGPAAGTSNHAPVVKTVSILPNPLNLSGPISVRVEAQDLDQQTVVFRYRWLVNGQVMSGQTLNSLPAHLLKRGDQVAVEVVPFDGITEGTPFQSVPVTVPNTAPIISNIAVDLDHEVQGRRLLAKVDVTDPDHDSITLTYRWRKNETVLKEGSDNALDLADLTAKDTVNVEVTASDGTPHGNTTVSERFTLTNSSPSIVSSPTASPRGDRYEYLVRATDPDGDPLTYALEVSPPGMTIEAQTGQIHWMISPETTGSQRVRVVAKDPQGGFATQDFDLSLHKPTKS
jgi:hypothetical protein